MMVCCQVVMVCCDDVLSGCRLANPSVIYGISMEIGRQYGCTAVFLMIRTNSFHKVRKSQHEQMRVQCQSFIDICMF